MNTHIKHKNYMNINANIASNHRLRICLIVIEVGREGKCAVFSNGNNPIFQSAPAEIHGQR